MGAFGWEPVGPPDDPDAGSGGTAAPPSTALPALPLRVPPPFGEPAPAGNTVRLYSSMGARKALPSFQVGECKWTVEPKGGFADGSTTIYFTPGQDEPSITDGDCIEIWSQGVRQWRGIVSDVTVQEDEPAHIVVAGYGRILDLERLVFQGAFQEPAPVDVSLMFGQIGAAIKAIYPDIIIQGAPFIGTNIQTLDTRLKTAREALDSLYDYCAGVAVYGFDVDPATGADRLYLRPVNTSTTDATIVIPSRNVGKRTFQRRAADVVNMVIVEGAAPAYPQLLPNGSFEALVTPSSADGSSNVLNGNFDMNSFGGDRSRNADHWALSSSATFLAGGQNGKPAAFSGGYFAELDTIGEWVEQDSDTPTVALVAGHSYDFGVWLHPESSADFLDPPVVTVTFEWRSGGAPMSGQSFTKVCTVQENTYQQFFRTIACPTGASGFGIHVELTGGDVGIGNKGVAVGYVYLVDVSTLKADKWDFRQNGSAQALVSNWQAGDAFDGLNCLYLSASAEDVDGQDLHIRCTPGYLYEIVGGETYRISVRVKSGPDGNAIPPLQIQHWWYKSDGTLTTLGLDRQAVASAVLGDWTYYHYDVTAPGDCTHAESWVAVRGTGDLFIDAISSRCISVDPAFSDESIDDTSYLPAGNLLAAFRADVEIAASENAAVNASVSTYGLRERVEHTTVTTITDARSFAHAYLLVHAIPNPDIPIDLYDDARPWAIGQGVSVTGRDAAIYGGAIRPVMRINGEIDAKGLLTLGLELTKPMPTDEEIVMGIIQRVTETQISEATGAASSGIGTTTPGYVSQPPAAGSAVTSLNTLTGALTVTGTGGIAVTESGGDINIDGSAITGGGITGVTAGTGLTASTSGEVVTIGIAAGGVGTTQIATGAVEAGQIAAGAVGTTALADGGVTSAKIPAGAVGSTQIADDSVGTIHIVAGSVTSTQLNGTGSAGSYTNASITVDAAGRITAASSGTSGGSGSSGGGGGTPSSPFETLLFYSTSASSAVTANQTLENIVIMTDGSATTLELAGYGLWTLVNARSSGNVSFPIEAVSGSPTITLKPGQNTRIVVIVDSSGNAVWFTIGGNVSGAGLD